MNINDAFPSNYLKASDLGDKQPIVTIADVKTEAIGRDKDQKPVLYFKGKDKGLVLNKTNSKRIAQLLGSVNTEDWEGRQILLYATETEYAGETVECIRVKAATGTGNGAKAVTAKSKAKPEPEPVIEVEHFDENSFENDEVPF